MIERLLKWLFKVLNNWSFRNPRWTRDDTWGDISEWHTWPVSGRWHDLADAGYMEIGPLLKVEQDPVGDMNLYILGRLVYWTARQSTYHQVWYLLEGLICHGTFAWETQVGSLVFMWYYDKPKRMNGLVRWGHFQMWWDWYWISYARIRFSLNWNKAIRSLGYQWFTWD